MATQTGFQAVTQEQETCYPTRGNSDISVAIIITCTSAFSMMTQGNFNVPMVCFICKSSNLLIYSNHFSTYFHTEGAEVIGMDNEKSRGYPQELKAIY